VAASWWSSVAALRHARSDPQYISNSSLQAACCQSHYYDDVDNNDADAINANTCGERGGCREQREGIYLSLSHVSETQNLSLSLASSAVLAGNTELRVSGKCVRERERERDLTSVERVGGRDSLNIQGEGLLIKCGCCRGWACTSIGTAFYEICRSRERNRQGI